MIQNRMRSEFLSQKANPAPVKDRDSNHFCGLSTLLAVKTRLEKIIFKSTEKGNNIWHEGEGSLHCNLRWATYQEQALSRVRGCYGLCPAEETWLENEVFTRARVPTTTSPF